MQPIARRHKISRVLEGAVLGNLFFEASTRTRVSFGAAFCRLGGSVCDTTGFTFSSMAKGESIYDTSRVMAGYVDALVIRHPEKGSVAEFARATNLPVINGGDGPGEHPSHASRSLYDPARVLAARQDRGRRAHRAGRRPQYGRTVHSLVKLLALYRAKFTLVSPPTLEMPAYIVDQIATNGHVIEQTTDLAAGLRGADVVYATRIQKERFTDESFEGYTPDFQINQALVDSVCKPDTLIMHPLPRDSRRRERPVGRPEPRPAPRDLPPDRQRHSGADGDLRGAARRREPRPAFDARRDVAPAGISRAGGCGVSRGRLRRNCGASQSGAPRFNGKRARQARLLFTR